MSYDTHQTSTYDLHHSDTNGHHSVTQETTSWETLNWHQWAMTLLKIALMSTDTNQTSTNENHSDTHQTYEHHWHIGQMYITLRYLDCNQWAPLLHILECTNNYPKHVRETPKTHTLIYVEDHPHPPKKKRNWNSVSNNAYLFILVTLTDNCTHTVQNTII